MHVSLVSSQEENVLLCLINHGPEKKDSKIEIVFLGSPILQRQKSYDGFEELEKLFLLPPSRAF